MKAIFNLLIILTLFPFSTLAQLQPQTVITVGSYNVYGLKYLAELKADLSRLPQVQIWAFQEVEGSFDQDTHNQILKILPAGKWYLYSEKINLIHSQKNIWEGQVIASRFPFLFTEKINLKHTDVKKRAALLARFKFESNKEFFFINTDHEVNLLSIDFKDRKKQLSSLVDYFNQQNNFVTTAGVITGDFNTTGGDDEIANTESVLAAASFRRVQAFDEDSYTFKKFFIQSELDHFFVRGARTSKRFRLDDRAGSDHFPIYIKIKL